MMHGVFGVSRDDRRLRNDGGGRNVVVARAGPRGGVLGGLSGSIGGKPVKMDANRSFNSRERSEQLS